MTKNFEYMYRRENNIIIKGINDEELTQLLLSIVSTISSGIEDWQKEYIFKDDDDIFNFNGDKRHAILMIEDWKNTTNQKEIDLRKLDFAALIKLLEYRLLDWNNKYSFEGQILRDSSKYRSFKDLLLFLRNDMRNLSSHTSPSDLEELFADNQLINQNLMKLHRLLRGVIADCESYLVKGKEIKEIISRFVDKQLNPIIDAYYMAKIGIDIDFQHVGDISIEELATYNVIVDYTIFLQEGGYRVVNNFVEMGKTIFAEQSLLVRLEKTQMQGVSANKEKAKEIVKTLESWVEKERIILLENANVIDRLNQTKSAKWCVLTLDAMMAYDVWKLQKENIIAVKPKNREKFEIYKGDVEVSGGNLSADKRFNVETVSYSEGTSLKEVKFSEETNSNCESNSYSKDMLQKKKQDEYYKFENQRIPSAGWEVFVGAPTHKCRDILSQIVSEGGEGKIYQYKSNGTEYAKIYKPEQLTQLRARKIESMVACKEDVPEEVCWPQEIVCHPNYEDKVIVGYSMQKAEKQGKKTLGTIRQVIMRIVKGEYQWVRRDLVQVCYNCSMLFEKLHKRNIWMGDVNPDNILVDEDKNVYFIDTDSYQFGEFNCPVGTIEFSSPELLEKMDSNYLGYADVRRTPEDEYFAVAVLYFYILFLSEFPYNIDANTDAKECILKHWFRFVRGKDSKRNYIWKNLTGELQQMFRDNFVESKRYSDAKWSRAFNNMIQMKDYVSDTYTRELSNEIFPYSAVENEGEVWENLVCVSCRKEYKVARILGTPLLPQEKECPRCKEIKKMTQKRIYKLKCPGCNELWTINEWDINGRDVSSLYCPDCDESFYYSKKAEFVEKGINVEMFEERIERQMSFAFKMYKEGLS